MLDTIQAIKTERIYGIVRGGIENCECPSLTELARRYGLADDANLYREVGIDEAGDVIRFVLHKDMAYSSELMTAKRAAEFADLFLSNFKRGGVRFYTNGNLHLQPDGGSWNPMTPATFDAGILALGQHKSGCLWVEDED